MIAPNLTTALQRFCGELTDVIELSPSEAERAEAKRLEPVARRAIVTLSRETGEPLAYSTNELRLREGLAQAVAENFGDDEVQP